MGIAIALIEVTTWSTTLTPTAGKSQNKPKRCIAEKRDTKAHHESIAPATKTKFHGCHKIYHLITIELEPSMCPRDTTYCRKRWQENNQHKRQGENTSAQLNFPRVRSLSEQDAVGHRLVVVGWIGTAHIAIQRILEAQ